MQHNRDIHTKEKRFKCEVGHNKTADQPLWSKFQLHVIDAFEKWYQTFIHFFVFMLCFSDL